MVASTQDFITNFHQLEGQTVRERCRNLRKLLNETKKSYELQEKLDFSYLQPLSPLEEIFKIDTIIYFKDMPEIIKILKSGNVIFIKRILKVSSLFLNEIFENITGEELVEKLFPHFSFNTKLKILNRLNFVNTKKAEEFYKMIRDNYGLYMASKMITLCSDEFIVKMLKSNKIEITCRQLLNIVKRCPDSIEDICEALSECLTNKQLFIEKYRKVFLFLMKNNLELFLKLEKKYNEGEFHLGYRASKSFLKKQDKNLLIRNSKQIYKYVKKEEIYKHLDSEDFQKFYINLFPTSSKEFKDNLNNLLAVARRSTHVNLVYKMYKSVYGCYLENDFITTKLLEIMSPDDREMLMENYSRPKNIHEDQWISFMKTEISLPLLKQKILSTSNIKSRAKIIPYLVLTCKLNNDVVGLSSICKYMLVQHRNDHWRVRQGFLKAILHNYNLTKLEEDHWKYVNELIEMGVFNNEFYYGNVDFYRGYIEFRLHNGLSIQEQLKKWIEMRESYLSIEDPKLQKQYLLLTYDLIHTACKSSFIDTEYINYLEELSNWNDKHPTDQFILYTYTKAMDCVKSLLRKGKPDFRIEKIILQCIKLNINEDDKNELLDLFLSCGNGQWWVHGCLFKWLLDNEPALILNYIGDITKMVLRSSSKSLWHYFKNYSHLGIPQKMCEILRQLIEPKEEELESYKLSGQEDPIKLLSYLLNTKDFLNLIETYYPINRNVDLQSQEGKWNCRLQRYIVLSIRNVFPSCFAIETIVRFSKHDPLNLTHRSLYAISYNTVECELGCLFQELDTQPISVRKHFIKLASKILCRNRTYEIYKKALNDKDSLMLKSLFKGTFEFFCNNPCEQSWELLKDTIAKIDCNNTIVLDILVKWNKIPKFYHDKYIMFTLKILEDIVDDSNTAQEQKGYFLDLILTSNVLHTLPEEFIIAMIKKHFLQPQSKVNSLVAKFITHYNDKSKQKERLDIVLKLLADFTQQQPDDYAFSISMHKIVFDFIKEYCMNCLQEKTVSSTANGLVEFITLFNKFFRYNQFLDEHLYLQLTLVCIQSKTLPEISFNLINLYDSLKEAIGMIFIDSFHVILKLFIPHLLLTKEDDILERNHYSLIERIMKSGCASDALVLGVLLLPNERPTLIDLRLKYEAIMKCLLKEQNVTVQLYLCKYLKSLNEVSK